MTTDDQFIILDGDFVSQPVGPFPSEAAAHAEYQRNQPHSKNHPYLTPPTIVRLLRPAHPVPAVQTEPSESTAVALNENARQHRDSSSWAQFVYPPSFTEGGE